MEITERTKRGAFQTPGLRIPPHDMDAERALLGSLMIKPQGLYEIMDSIKPHSFYADRNRIIFEAILVLCEKNEPVDLISVTSLLREKNLLETVGGAVAIADLTEMVPNASNLKHYADIVHKKYVLRRLIGASEDLSTLGYTEDEAIDSLLDKAGRSIFELTNYAKRSFVAIKDTLAEAWERFDRLHKSDNTLRGVPTGFDYFGG